MSEFVTLNCVTYRRHNADSILPTTASSHCSTAHYILWSLTVLATVINRARWVFRAGCAHRLILLKNSVTSIREETDRGEREHTGCSLKLLSYKKTFSYIFFCSSITRGCVMPSINSHEQSQTYCYTLTFFIAIWQHVILVKG